MGIQSRDGMELLVGECVNASFTAFREDLERRLVIRLHQESAFTPAVRVNIAQSVSNDIAGMLLNRVWESGVMHDTLQRLL